MPQGVPGVSKKLEDQTEDPSGKLEHWESAQIE